ncbi:DUF3313 domain-containing protein (plasmid) [Agrobacterium tumefaciens]|jgi:hypothetical protein|uniref:DUF3313 domain-containing protein n=1 Tax=Agrobacterium TaxID=357 RepID=UPI00080F8DA7|nr:MULTISPECIES: DUF3313 domain-containing protein [Agrobacterium]NSZ76855.1 DUF3313 domain-containing protein [Agrobacterium tumefaciens]NSZ87335.1 DUF3313 domain-containing protein [Agrobacterium tumefaciens]UZX45358.1 DUF3313 domain-containing protein [Agrobacterium sp. 13-2099-1-2]WCA72767.1 DUF3313 domain-containing protein [Agrobacterium tumefaciens]
MSRHRLRLAWLVLPTAALLAGCTSVPLKEGGTLTSYSQLSPPKGKFTKSRTFVDAQGLSGVRTVSIVPTTFSFDATSRIKSPQDRALVSNALDRAVCVSLSDKYQIVPTGQPADLIVRTVVTDIVATNKTMAGVSTAVSLGSSLALPVGIPRLPVGLGGLAVEAEAIDISGTQRAAVVWSKGANSITNNARVSEVGDAYSLAANFGKYLSRMLVSGKEPNGLDLSLPSAQRMNSALGGKPKYAACDAFGRSPGLAGIVADKVGAPPEWTDKQPKTPTQQTSTF